VPEVTSSVEPGSKQSFVLTRQAANATPAADSDEDSGKFTGSNPPTPESNSTAEARPPTPTIEPTPVLPRIDYPVADGRDLDPVIMTGIDVDALTGILPGQIAGFRYADGIWTQIPIQIDERDWIDLRDVRRRNDPTDALVYLLYTDTNTRVGADSDPLFDADDELVFMYRDGGEQAEPNAIPPNVFAQSGFEVALRDPLNPDAMRYVYLFQHDGTLDPSADVRYVGYDFQLLPEAEQNREPVGYLVEDSTFASAHYTQHMMAPWTVDGLRLTTSGTESVDLLDRLRVQFEPGDCQRNEDVMSWSQPDYLINRSGPIRALRGFVGANSGAFTQRVHIMYAQRQDVVTDLRVHAIPGIMMFMDYAPAATGMTYANNLLPVGVIVDGVADEMPAGQIEWELLTGAPGSIVSTIMITSTVPELTQRNFYEDAVEPASAPCTGDSAYYGASGVYVPGPIPCTDPARAAIGPRSCPTVYLFQATQTFYYLQPNVPVSTADALNRQSRQPVAVDAQAIGR
jgi:hypothetical protein